MATKRTRVRRTSITKSVNPSSLKSAKALADDIESRKLLMAKLANENEGDLAKLHVLMQDLKIEEVQGEIGKGEIYSPRSNSTTTYDNVAAFNMMHLEDFLASVKMIKDKASDFLSGKELQSISTTKPGKKKPKECRVVPVSK